MFSIGGTMKTMLLRATAVGLALVSVYLLLGTSPSGGTPTGGSDDPVARGAYLTTVLGCQDCHTPKRFTETGPVLDSARAFSGHPEDLEIRTSPASDPVWTASTTDHMTAWSGPWGISYATNLTPDLETGMGGWSEAMFIKALRTGTHMGEGRPILPPMPWQAFGKLTDQDLRAIFAYLQTVPPVTNVVPDPIPPDQARSRTQ